MTPSSLARHLFSTYERYRLDDLTPQNCKHERVFAELFDLVVKSDKLMAMEELGSTIEDRSIQLIRIGRGHKRVLLWSQMHGDESTATLALMDIFNFFVHSGHDKKWVREMLDELTLCFIPMLNPDGAERIERRTAVGIDMNRDALDLATPEAHILRNAQRRLKPTFGFNLHDQELSSVGNSKNVTALALLAPALDEKKTRPPGRVRAIRVAALIARTLDQFVHGHLATYDDAFEPRAFGDNMQRWGTSTVLIESGHWPDDGRKIFIRKLNYVGILSALHGISNGSYQDVDMDYYTHLVPNGKRVYDLIIRGVKLRHQTGWSHAVDIGLSIDPQLNKEPDKAIVTIKDLGDLKAYGALRTVDGASRVVSTNQIVVNQSISAVKLFGILQLPNIDANR